jgi:uncharacterized protein (TIGR04141 family)
MPENFLNKSYEIKFKVMDIENKKSYKLCIYLLKEEIKEFKSALKKDVYIQKEYNFNEKIKAEGTIIIGASKSSQPEWRELLQEAVDVELPDLNNSSNRAILFIKIETRIFALPFGYGKHLLKEEAIDRDFGLITVLNILDADKLMSIDKANLNDLTVLTRTQTSRKARPETFDIDIIKDLLKSVTGAPSESHGISFGNIITGNEGIYMIPTINFVDIPEKLIKLKKAFESNKYKLRFGWIDNIKPVKDPSVLDLLKTNLVKDLIQKDNSKIHLAFPYLIDWDLFEGFSYTPKGELETDFVIENFYEKRSDDFDGLNWDKLSRFKIYLKEGTDKEKIETNILKFINYQTELNDDIYILALSKWYKVKKTYVDELKKYVNQIEESNLLFIDCAAGYNEGEYNKQLAESQEYYNLLDKDLVHSDLVYSGIEACDVISDSMEFIHVKFRKSSSTLSHLFAQGKISAYALKKDKTYRKNLRTKLDKFGWDRDLVPLENRKVDTHNYTITFALIENKKRTFVEALPFFSLLNFRLTAEELLTLGYNVKVKKIEIK